MSSLARLALAAWLLPSCSGPEPFGDVYEPCLAGAVRCFGLEARRCNARGDGWESVETCEGHLPICEQGFGCVACRPGARRCQGATVLECDAEGLLWGWAETCSAEDFCYDGRCGGDCARAGVFRSYEGCDYLAVTLMNSQLSPDFSPAIVVSNRNDEPITVSVTRRGEHVASAEVAPRSTATVELPWVRALKGSSFSAESVNVPGGAYRVRTTLPATVYQFNPLEYALDRDCAEGDAVRDGRCHSYTNDASLLLPVPVLTEHYIVMSRPNLGIRIAVEGEARAEHMFSPSVLAIANPQDHPVTVEVLFSAETAWGAGLGQHRAGETATFTIQPEGVLQIAGRSPETCEPDWVEPETFPCGPDLECRYGYCALPDRDLTGTEVVASAPVAVFGAHDCDFVPFNRWACDHLEEQLFPYETWGRSFVVAQAVRDRGEPDVFRVLSGSDANEVRFVPEEVHGPVRLDRGAFVELEARGSFSVEADGPILLGQFLVGQSYDGFSTDDDLPPGDPSFSLAVPVEQHRSAYNFLAPASFDRSFANLSARDGSLAGIVLDGENLAGAPWDPVPGTTYWTLRREVAAGSHVVASVDGAPFGITVYGYGQYTSYMYPGGLDLEPIAVW